MITFELFTLDYDADTKEYIPAECYGCDGDGRLWVTGHEVFTYRVACDNPECDYTGGRSKDHAEVSLRLVVQK